MRAENAALENYNGRGVGSILVAVKAGESVSELVQSQQGAIDELKARLEAVEQRVKKIMVDPDVVTTAVWDRKDDAVKFIERAKAGEFVIYTPFALHDTLSSWGHENLRRSIGQFYELHSARIISAEEYVKTAAGMKMDEKAILGEFLKAGVKGEDALLVIISSVFSLDAIVTFNRKHLHNNKEAINDILRRHNLNEISILLPNEL